MAQRIIIPLGADCYKLNYGKKSYHVDIKNETLRAEFYKANNIEKRNDVTINLIGIYSHDITVFANFPDNVNNI